MTLDSIVASLGSDARNLGAHSLILVQQQQQALPVAGASQPGCGGAQALIQCCYNRLTHSNPRRTRGIIVLSMDHTARAWTSAPLPGGDSAPRLILDAVTLRFPLHDDAPAPAASEPVSLPSQPGTSVQQLLPHEINNLATLRSIFERAAQRFTAEYEAAEKIAAALPAAAAAPSTAAATDLFSLAGSDPSSHDAAPSCSSVTVVVDDVVSMMVRFGTSPTLAFLQGLKSLHSCAANVIAAVDMDGVAALGALAVGGCGGAANQVSLHAHLSHLATTSIAIRSLRPVALGSSIGGGLFQACVHVVHKRSSGRVSNVVEEVEMDVKAGVVRKVVSGPGATAEPGGKSAAAASAASSAASAAASAASTPSLAAQFGSSFSLDLSSKARSARAATVLPYQHTGQAGGWNDAAGPSAAGGGGSSLDGPEEAEELMLSDDDQDFDDPDDDLEV